MRFLFPHGTIFYADNAKESAVADFRVKTTDLSIQRYTRGGKDVILSHILSIRERLNLYGLPCHVNYRKACKRFEETWRVRLEHRKSYRRFVEAGRVRLDHRKACRRLVEDWRIRLDHRKSCRRVVEDWRIRLNHRKPCRRLEETRKFVLNTAKRIGGV